MTNNKPPRSAKWGCIASRKGMWILRKAPEYGADCETDRAKRKQRFNVDFSPPAPFVVKLRDKNLAVRLRRRIYSRQRRGMEKLVKYSPDKLCTLRVHREEYNVCADYDDESRHRWTFHAKCLTSSRFILRRPLVRIRRFIKATCDDT